MNLIVIDGYPGPLTLRVAGPRDAPFVQELYRANRAAELAAAPWPEAMKNTLLDDQLRLQTAHFDAVHPAADRWIVERAASPVGRLLVARGATEWRLIDIGLIPTAQGLGIGGALIRWLIAGASAAKVPVVLHVAHDNLRAARLYEQWGFVETESASDTHRRMTRA